jgi:hypothetical protein
MVNVTFTDKLVFCGTILVLPATHICKTYARLSSLLKWITLKLLDILAYTAYTKNAIKINKQKDQNLDCLT